MVAVSTGPTTTSSSSGTSTSKATKALLSTRAKRDRACTWLSAALIVGAFFIRVFFLTSSSAKNTYSVLYNQQQQYDTTTISNNGVMALPAPEPSFLPLDPTCTMANDNDNDIVSIQHIPKDSSFVVTLKRDGKCPHPYLRGRLSGPALVLLEWSTIDDNDNNSNPNNIQLIGSYQVPVSGLYFVELIVVTCHDFSQDMDFDFQDTCVEDPTHHRLLKGSAKVSIAASDNNNHHHNPTNSNRPTMGYWRHQLDERFQQQDFAPVLTRFQPPGCLRLDDPTHDHFVHPPRHCVEPTDLHRFDPYTQNFEYTTHAVTTGGQVPWWEGAHRIQATQPTTICLVGGSHSRTLLASLVKFHNFTLTNNNVHIDWIKAKFPRDVNNKTISTQMFLGENQQQQPYCDKLLLAVGQWPASFSGGKPTSFREYAVQIGKMLGRLQDHYLRKSPGTEVWLRSIHENPLNERIAGHCPPKDWRSPTVLEGYNHILRRAASAANDDAIRFVSTQFIVQPLWDASSDWGHVLPLASHAEALYLVAVVLGFVLPNTE